jgi:phosphatidylglycerophosphate synthase
MADLSAALILLNVRPPGAREIVGGITLVARILYHLESLGLKKAVLLTEGGKDFPDIKRRSEKIEIQWVETKGDLSADLEPLAGLSERFIYLDADHLVDPRLLRALVSAATPTLLALDNVDRERPIIRAALLSREDLMLWAQQGSSALISRAHSLFPEDVDPFHPEIRGPLKPYFMEIRTGEDARRATRLLIRSQQKHVMDLPAQYLHPPLANALTSLLVRTSIPPNLVSIATASIAFLISWLFWHGYFFPGALLTFLVDVLDGVDGKLARTKLQFSRLGKQEHILDYLYENTYYVALGVGLSSLSGGSLPLVLAGLMVTADTVDNLFYTLAGAWYGKSIDLFSPFDARFRRIAGRRNIYCSIFIIGFALGFPLQTFAAASFWAAITATVHGLRLRQYGRDIKKAGGTTRSIESYFQKGLS